MSFPWTYIASLIHGGKGGNNGGGTQKKKGQLTSPRLDQLVHLMAGVHRAEVEELDGRARLLQLGGVVGRRRELLQDLAAHARSGLLHLDHGAVAEVALDEEDHLVIPHEHFVAANVVEPPLHQRLDPCFVLIRPHARRGSSKRDIGYEGFGIGRYEMLGKFLEFGVESAHITVLRSPESRKVGLDLNQPE